MSLKKLKSVETESTKMDIALFTLYKLGGVSKKIHIEEIAWGVEANQGLIINL